MGAKGKYRIHNWKEYNKSLIRRGSITIWFSEDAIEKWLARKESPTVGHPPIYSDDAILTALMIRLSISSSLKGSSRISNFSCYVDENSSSNSLLYSDLLKEPNL